MAVAELAERDEAPEAVRRARLRYMLDDRPGIRRRGRPGRFEYVDEETGRRIEDLEVLARIKNLAIPPAWKDVWICPVANGHMQATGRDQRGRKQYRYHRRWREVRDEHKYGRMLAFAEALPKIRTRVDEDLRRRGLPREKVLAAVVRLLELTDVRVGNREYARDNGSFGLTTLRDRHARVTSAAVTLRFVGKGGKEREIDVRDRRLARVVQRSRDLPGYELFQYVDEDGERRRIDASDVNDYLREITGQDFTAKDFRTWDGTVLAALALREIGPARSEAQAKRNVKAAVEQAAEALANTVTVCSTSYIHPAVIDAYLEGRVLPRSRGGNGSGALDPDERAVLAFLRRETGA